MGINKMMNTLNKKIIISIVIFVLLIGIISVIYIILSGSNTKQDPTKEASYTITYVDPGSGETVITTPNKTPENADGNNITMLGFSKLISDYGMTFEQVQTLQSEFSDYSISQKTPIKEISITLASVKTTINPDTGNVIDRFTVTIDRGSTLTAQVEYFGIDDPTLKLYNSKTNKLVFDSK